MKITKVESLPVDRFLFVKIYTDEGIVGYGESGAWGFLEPSASAIDKFGRYLVGKNPLTIEHHWQYMYRFSHFRGAAIMGALSALDIALWDIMGKYFGVPVHQLLGGKTRDRARVYYHVFGSTREELIDGVKGAKAEGFTAVGHLTPFLDEDRELPYFKTHASKIRDAIDTVGMYRDAVGDSVDLCIEIHRRLTPAEAVVLARGIEDFHPYFYEDPILPENFDAMGLVANNISVPIATGERLHSIHEFQMLLSRGAVQYVRPDVCLAGGITHTKKIAAIAEANYVEVVPHNPLGPICTAASVHLGAAVPNFAWLEINMERAENPDLNIFTEQVLFEGNGYKVPDKPGLGVEVDESKLTQPFAFWEAPHPHRADGSHTNW